MKRSGGNLTAFFLFLSLLVTAAWVRSYAYVTQYHAVRVGPAPAGRYMTERSWVGLGSGCLYVGGYRTECQGYGIEFADTTNDRMFWQLPMAAGRYLCPTADWQSTPGAWTLVRDAMGFCAVCHRQTTVEPPGGDADAAAGGSIAAPREADASEAGPPHITELRRGWLLGIPCWFVLLLVLLPAGWRWPLALPRVARRIWHFPGEFLQIIATLTTGQRAAHAGYCDAPGPFAGDAGSRERLPAHDDPTSWHAMARLGLAEHRLRVRHAHHLHRTASSIACPGLLPRSRPFG